MRQIYLIAVFFSCSFLWCFAQRYTLSFTDEEADAESVLTPERTVTEYPNYIDVTYQISEVDVVEIKQENETYSLIKINGFSGIDNVGKPQLPLYNDIITLPNAKDIEISILATEYKDFENLLIIPSKGPETDVEQDMVLKKDPVIYNSNSYYPAKIVDIVSVQDYREIPIAFVQIRPVQYNPVTKKLRCYSKITYRITHGGAWQDKVVEPSAIKQLKTVSANSLNLAPLSIKSLTVSNNDKNFIIVTTEKYLPAIQSFAAWKTQTGNKCEIISRSTWTWEEVKEAVHSRYASWSPKPEYLLIVGDQEDVPGRLYSSSYGNYASDLQFACMGGDNDYTADMAFGRISVSSLEEAQTVIKKIMDYEQHPIGNASFYATALHCAQFQDDNKDGYADRRFTHTSEEIRDYMLTQGKKVNRVYYADSDVTPRHYNDGRYSDGQPISSELRKDISPFFSWDGNNQDILSEINQGRCYVLHRDHGYYHGWGHPDFSISDIDNLNNGQKLPIVFSLNCQTGGFLQKECFAEKFLRLPSGGAVGVVAASQVSYSGYSDAIAAGLFDAMYPLPGLIPDFGIGNRPTVAEHEGIYPMGHVLNHGLLRMGQTWGVYAYQNKIFHYFGDPSMEMYTSTPQRFNSVTVKKDGNNISINTQLTDCKITISSAYDMGETFFETVNAANHTFTDVPEPYCITITKHNYIPYVYFSDCHYVQNEMITTDRHIKANKIYVGKNVTTSKPQGNVIIKNGAHVIFEPSEAIEFNAGFECEAGSTFEVIKQ